MKLIFFGAGYCSKFILPRIGKEFTIICTHQTNVKTEEFDKSLKIKRLTLSDFIKKKDFFLKDVTHIINSIPPFKNEDLVYNLIDSMGFRYLNKLKWFGYLSSTSVYGDHSGNWVDENTKTKPKTTRGKSREKVENLYLSIFKKIGFPSHIFRLPGIYGPKRSTFEKLLSGNRFIIKKKSHYFSRIHVEDIASAILVSMNRITPGEIFNLTDNYPCSAEEVTKYAADLLKIYDMKFVDVNAPEINERIRDFYSDNKRVSNKKIKKILGWTPKFENYKLGLLGIYKKNQWQKYYK